MLFEDEDMPFEEDCLRDPFNLRCWLRYIDFKAKNCTNWLAVYLIYERALKQVPGRLAHFFVFRFCFYDHSFTSFVVISLNNTSYRLWYNYLKLRRTNIRNKPINDPEYDEVNNVYDRALTYMNKVSIFK